ncbi:MAG TPA: hypothetical protein VG291_03725 [Xanthobacteraceae bacterium]|jgi:hypothetical protein|nr:hypothetical protein [Xanthobacteraceae bacterium]
MLASLDAWIARQDDQPSRPEAIRRLVELGLAGARPIRQQNPKTAAQASDMAGRRIDKIGDPSATVEERQDRKRRLIKGPREFRDIRGDQRKPKS